MEHGRYMEDGALFFSFFIVNCLFLRFNKEKMIELQGVANNQDFCGSRGIPYSIL